MAKVIFDSFCIQKNNEPIIDAKGNYLCYVLLNGVKKVISISEKSLYDAGYLKYKETQKTEPEPSPPSKQSGSSLNLPQPSGSGLKHSQQSGSGINPSEPAGSGLKQSQQSGSGLNPSEPSRSGLNQSETSGSGLNSSETSGSSLNSSETSGLKEWSSNDTRLLLDKYEHYMCMVGPMKKFRNKKVMWEKISKDLEELLGINWSGEQCASRYKTVMRRKKDTEKNNGTSGSTRKTVEFEEEISKISALDDSLEPEVARGVSEVKMKEKNSTSPPKKRSKKQSVAETLYNLHKLREEGRENRHKEKMELFKQAFMNN